MNFGFPFLDQFHDVVNVPKLVRNVGGLGGRHADR